MKSPLDSGHSLPEIGSSVTFPRLLVDVMIRASRFQSSVSVAMQQFGGTWVIVEVVALVTMRTVTQSAGDHPDEYVASVAEIAFAIASSHPKVCGS
jgi:hypothetical protein